MSKRIHSMFFLFLAAVVLEAAPRVYLTGATGDVEVVPEPGILLMGGGGDVDSAMAWFLGKARGGDVVILRASGSDGYNRYFYEELGVEINSVRSLVFSGRGESADAEMLSMLRKAEAIFLAGGDQSNYLRFWKDTPVEDALNAHVKAGRPIGGTSAGLAVLGDISYAALHDGDLTSELALRRPDHHWITLEDDFLEVPFLEGILTDSHFSERRRLGRLMVMLARAGLEGMGSPIGLGIDERTALCVEADGSVRLHGEGKATVVLTGEVQPLERGPFGPQTAEVFVLGPESIFNLRTRAVEDPFNRMTVLAAGGELHAVVPGTAEGEAERPVNDGGSLVIVGGALRAGNDSVYEEFIGLGNLHTTGLLGVIPAASGKPSRSARAFMKSLEARGIAPGRMRLIPLAVLDDSGTEEVNEADWRKNAVDPRIAGMIRESSAIWFTGGDQSRIMEIFGGKEGGPLREALLEVMHSGGVIGGTSAGAAVQSEVMIVGGSSPGALRYGTGGDYASMKEQERGPLVLGEGLGYFPHGVIDQHFDRKARLGRLIVALLESGLHHGFGIDEDTALIYDAGADEARVSGLGTVIMVDVSEAKRENGAILNIRLSALAEGDRLRWPGPTVAIHPRKEATRGKEYMEISEPAASGIMDPYGGRVADVLGYLLTDNAAAEAVESRIQYPDGACRDLTFRMDSRTRGYWATLDGEMDSYSVLEALLDIGPEH